MRRPRACRRFLFAAAWLGILGWTALAADAATKATPPVLLVHGVAWGLDEEDATWGEHVGGCAAASEWSGMIGFLESKGFRYGGAIRPVGADVALPDRLDTTGTRFEPSRSDLFVLKFSRAANTDGVALKALELAESIRQLCRFTGAEKVRLVAHSAGGIIARAYLQDALPGVGYRGDVERLVTIATPHLGSSLAEHWGDFLGTRATSIKPTAALIQDLNAKLDLPDDVTFASIVVRGIAADTRGKGKDFEALVNHAILDLLPVEYRFGGDQVVHVRSQNLRLAQCAARYEKRTGRPIQYVLARVPDPTESGFSLRDLTDVRVHVAAPYDQTVEELVFGLLNRKAVLWSQSSPEKLAEWCDWQARVHANGVIEAEAMGVHPMSMVSVVKIDDFQLVASEGLCRRYAFDGQAWSRNVAIPCRKRWTHVRGTVALTFDPFGRVVAETTDIQQRSDG